VEKPKKVPTALEARLSAGLLIVAACGSVDCFVGLRPPRNDVFLLFLRHREATKSLWRSTAEGSNSTPKALTG
jgi:membrane-bound metal-dependent hydrolase YbcI (DUF457 family)